MKFNLKLNNNKYYSEIGQKNPLRWKVLYKNADTSLEDQTGWIKCKDFFNDSVAYFKAGSEFEVCGYQSKIKKNDEGVYFLLKYITDMKSFLANIDVVSAQIHKDLGTGLTCVPNDGAADEAILLIPNELWESTYRISLVTFVIRCCNYGYQFKSWKDVWATEAPSHTQERAFSVDAINRARDDGFKLPEKYAKYWFFAGKDHNSEKAPNTKGGIIHNNGCTNWNHWMRQEA